MSPYLIVGPSRISVINLNHVHKSLPLVWAWVKWIQSLPLHALSWRYVWILSSHLHLGLPSGFPTKTLYAFLFSPIHPTYPIFLALCDDLITCHHDHQFALSTFLPSVYCGAPFPFWHIVPLAPVCLLHILIHTPGLANHLSSVTWCPWLRRRSLAVRLLVYPTIHFLQGHYSDILSNILYKIPHTTIFSFTQFHWFCSQSHFE